MKLSGAEEKKFRARYGVRALGTAIAIKKVARTPAQRAHFAKLARKLERNPLHAQARRAAHLYTSFTKQRAEPFGFVTLPDVPKAAAIMGYCDTIEYATVREGGKKQYFRHEFAERDRPLLCVGPDGTPILLVGGHYRWTDRGIVDRSDRSGRTGR